MFKATKEVASYILASYLIAGIVWMIIDLLTKI